MKVYICIPLPYDGQVTNWPDPRLSMQKFSDNVLKILIAYGMLKV